MEASAEGDERYRQEVRAMSYAVPAAVSVLDPDGQVLWVNPFWRRLTGLTLEQSTGAGWRGSAHPDDLAAVDAAFAEARAATRGFETELRLRTAGGAWRWSMIRGEPLTGKQGRLGGWITVSSDIHEQKLTADALRESEERFRLVAENAPVNLWMGDAEGRCVYLNQQQRAFWGVAEDLSGFSWADTLVEEDREGLFAVFGEAMASHSPFEVEARYKRADGEIRILRTQANPRHDAKGDFLGMIGVNVDVTEARRAELHQRLLTNELNHRVKNTLATVQSLAYQTLRAYQDVDQARRVLDGRLMALSAAHNVLNRENWEAAELADVVAEGLRAYETPGSPRLHTKGPAARVGPQAALAVAMVLHELATNAVKYGALSVEGGRVELTWTFSDDERNVDLLWRESGGPPVTPPDREGFGSRLLASVASDLGAPADLRYLESGLVCAFAAPLANPELL